MRAIRRSGCLLAVLAMSTLGCGGNGGRPDLPVSAGFADPNLAPTVVLPGGEMNPEQLSVLWRSPEQGSTVSTQACGSMWVLPIQMDFLVRPDQDRDGAILFAELFNMAGIRCAYGFGLGIGALHAGRATLFSVRRFSVARENVPSECQYPAHVATVRAHLLGEFGSVRTAERLSVAVFKYDIHLVGQTGATPGPPGRCPGPWMTGGAIEHLSGPRGSSRDTSVVRPRRDGPQDD